jgi:prepilin-type N-terminal cleavage/methylation domain-containing protein
MILTDIKNKNQGFTIVELLIVVVVIAILAAITIVSYNGITNRANASAAQSAAASVQKKAEAYNAELASYPATFADLTGATSDKSYYLTGVSATAAVGTAPTATNGKNTVQYTPCGINSSVTTTAPTSQANIGTTIANGTFTGAEIRYFNFSGGTTLVSIGQTSLAYASTGKTVGCPTS